MSSVVEILPPKLIISLMVKGTGNVEAWKYKFLTRALKRSLLPCPPGSKGKEASGYKQSWQNFGLLCLGCLVEINMTHTSENKLNLEPVLTNISIGGK